MFIPFDFIIGVRMFIPQYIVSLLILHTEITLVVPPPHLSNKCFSCLIDHGMDACALGLGNHYKYEHEGESINISRLKFTQNDVLLL